MQFSEVAHKVENSETDIKLTLYHTPCACSRVVLNAIEEMGEPYKEAPITLAKGEQYTPEYLSINPKGKIPGLIDGGKAFTESPAILFHLASSRPNANLLPKGLDGRPTSNSLSDMIWCTSALHPAMNKVVFPQNTSSLDAEGIRERNIATLEKAAKQISARYENSPWYYGSDWSIVDVYFTWIYNLAGQFTFPLENYPKLIDLRRHGNLE